MLALKTRTQVAWGCYIDPCSKACSKAYATLQLHYDKLTVDFRKSQFDVLSYNSSLESVEDRLLVYQQNENVFAKHIKLLKLDVILRDNALVELRKKFKKVEQERYELKLTLEKFQTSSKNLSILLASQITDKTGLGYDNQMFTSTIFDCDELNSSESDVSVPTSLVYDRYKSGEGYHAVSPPYTGTFIPPKPDLGFHDALTVIKTVPNVINVEPKDESKGEPMPTQKEPSFVQTSEHVKTLRTSVKNPKGGKITGKGKIKTRKLDFDDVYFVKELKFNLFSVSQMCDNKNSVLFTDTKCVALSFDFKLPDENHVLLRVPRENNMYNFRGMKGIKREFSVARTPQQNGVAERKNKTLIEAARTMLADSLLPIPFWDETVNTACYVQNRVLVTKPHNKTPYELLLGITPSIGFMRPFGCLVTILNTPDLLGKFDGKVDEGFLIGYSISSKAFRVFNSRTIIVQETLHIKFLENQPNVAGSGPTWLFDIDTLTQSINYQPVVIRNQPNSSVQVSKEILMQNSNADVASDVKENEFEVHVSPRVKDLTDEFEEFSVNSTNRVNAASTPVTAVRLNSTKSTNSFNDVGTSDNVVSPNFEIGGKYSFMDSQYRDDPDMSALEDIVYSDDEEDVGAEADFSNLETSITTRSMARMVKEQGGLNQINDEDFHTCMFACFLSQEEPNRVDQELKDPSWIEAMQEELLQFKMQKEEGIDYEEVFSLVARIEAIRLFLAYTSFMGFMVYQMDVKSAFLYGTIKEEVYVCQPLGFKDPNYPDKQKDDRIFISQDKYVAVILRKFGLTDVKRIFRYLKRKPHLGLWYPKDSPFNLVAYSDNDNAGASLDRKSTTGGCQFLGVNTPRCDEDSLELMELRYALMVNPIIYVSCIKQFWASVLIKKSNDVVKLQALIDRKKVIITEDTIRQNLRLDDANGIDCLPNEEIFAELARMGYEKPSTKLTFYKAFFLAQWKFLIHTIVQCMSAKRTAWNEFSSSMASAVICLATVMINEQIDDLSSHNTKYTSPALTQKVFANMRRIGKGFSGVETPLFDAMLVKQQVHDDAEVKEDKDDNEVPAAPSPPTPATTSTPQQEPIPSPPKLNPLNHHHHPNNNLLKLLTSHNLQ
nr:hypothetical protein [Tanacetum cinerariifolium]